MKALKAGESLEDAAYRTINEELGLLLQVDDAKDKVWNVVGTYKKEGSEMMSWSYLELRSGYVIHTAKKPTSRGCLSC